MQSCLRQLQINLLTLKCNAELPLLIQAHIVFRQCVLSNNKSKFCLFMNPGRLGLCTLDASGSRMHGTPSFAPPVYQCAINKSSRIIDYVYIYQYTDTHETHGKEQGFNSSASQRHYWHAPAQSSPAPAAEATTPPSCQGKPPARRG